MRNKLLPGVILVLAIVLVLATYFIFFNKKVENSFITAPPVRIDNGILDTRFWSLYGQVSKLSTSSISVEVIKDPMGTDYIFNDIQNVTTFTNKDTLLKRFDQTEKVYLDISISDIKVNDFVRVHIDNTISTEYKAIGIELFGTSSPYINE